jgi:hypothetical protein
MKYAFTTRANDPFPLREGVLNVMFDDLIAQWARQVAAQTALGSIKADLASAWFPLMFAVSNRFVNTLGSNLFSEFTRLAFAAQIGVLPENLRDFQVRRNIFLHACHVFVKFWPFTRLSKANAPLLVYLHLAVPLQPT